MFKKIKSTRRIINKKEENKIPAIIYGKNIKNINIYIKKKEIKFGKYKIHYKNKIYKSVIKNIQYNPINNEILHIDFYKTNRIKNIVEVPIKIKNPKKYNYILSIKKIKLICKIKIPKEICLNISKNIKKIRANQIKIPENTNLTTQMIEENPIILKIY